MAEELLTARLSLRRPVPADVDAIFGVHRDPLACAYNPGDLLTSCAEAEQLYGRWDAHWQRHAFGYWVVRPAGPPAPDSKIMAPSMLLPRREGRHDHEEGGPGGAGGGEPIGFCGVKVMALHGREVLNLLYRFAPATWGNGYATEAARAVVNWAAARAPERPLIARIRPGNAGSIRVATRIGLTRAAHLDTADEDGPDWIFVSHWPD